MTLGLYRFWLFTDMRQYLWSNTVSDGESLEYTGTPVELLLGFLIAIGIAAGWLLLRASLPILDGTVPANGLSATVTVDRDRLGVPTISGVDRGDLAYATGFLHAQDRFFQIDLLRRVAAGELAELLGPAALDLDRRHRLHRFRSRALAVLAAATADERRG